MGPAGHRVSLLIALFIAGPGCATTSSIDGDVLRQVEARVGSLRKEQQQRQVELDALRGQISRAEAELQQRQATVQRSRCEALVARTDALVTVGRAQCFRQMA